VDAANGNPGIYAFKPNNNQKSNATGHTYFYTGSKWIGTPYFYAAGGGDYMLWILK
jgi:hypothetical protein